MAVYTTAAAAAAANDTRDYVVCTFYPLRSATERHMRRCEVNSSTLEAFESLVLL